MTSIAKYIKENINKYNINVVSNIVCEQKHIEEFVIQKYMITYIQRNIRVINNILNGTRTEIIQITKLHSTVSLYFKKHSKTISKE